MTATKGLLDGPYATVAKVVFVQDNLNAHGPSFFDEAFAPAQARRLVERIEWHSTPKHGSWLNLAEVEFSALEPPSEGTNRLTRRTRASQHRVDRRTQPRRSLCQLAFHDNGRPH